MNTQMELLKQQVKLILSLVMLVMSLTGRAQSSDQEAATLVDEKPYEIGTYMGINRTVNLMIRVHQVTGITIKIKDANDTIIHEQYMKKSLKVYHYKLNFADSQSGQYKLEISDGRKILTRRIEVVDVPATEAQRYITFTTPVNL